MVQRSSTFLSAAQQTLLERLISHTKHVEIGGPLPWFNPTRARIKLSPQKLAQEQADSAGATPRSKHAKQESMRHVEGAQIEWRARDNRKGAISIKATSERVTGTDSTTIQVDTLL